MADEIRGILEQFPGIQFEVLTFLGDRIGETLTGETAPVVVNIFGDDLDVLDAKAQEVAKVLQSVPGAADVQVKSPPGAPRIAVRLRPDRLTQFGFRPVEVLEAIQTAYQGTVVAQTHRGNQVADVAVILDADRAPGPGEPSARCCCSSASGVRHAAARTGGHLSDQRPPLDPARRRPPPADGDLRRQRARRDLLRRRRETASRGQGRASRRTPTPHSAARPQAKEKAQRELLLHSAIAAVGILLLLTIVFHNTRNLLLVLANVPFALVGGVLAVWLTGCWQADFARDLLEGQAVADHRLAGRLRDALRHHHAQLDHDDFALRAPGERGRHDLGPGGGHARGVASG